MSLRARLLMLVLLATLLPALLMGWRFMRDREVEIASAVKALSAAADRIAEDLDQRVQGTAQLHYGLAYASILQTEDRVACSAYLSEVREAYPQYTGIITVLPSGELHCDSLRTARRAQRARPQLLPACARGRESRGGGGAGVRSPHQHRGAADRAPGARGRRGLALHAGGLAQPQGIRAAQPRPGAGFGPRAAAGGSPGHGAGEFHRGVERARAGLIDRRHTAHGAGADPCERRYRRGAAGGERRRRSGPWRPSARRGRRACT